MQTRTKMASTTESPPTSPLKGPATQSRLPSWTPADTEFKIDLTKFPELSSRGDNYIEWRTAWLVAFKYAEVWDIINGTTVRTTQNEADWDSKDAKAMMMLISATHQDHMMIITTSGTSAKAWKHLAQRFDRDTGNSAIFLFRALRNLRYKDGDDLRSYLDTFHQLWIRTERCYQLSDQSEKEAMQDMFTSNDLKGIFFLTTLPDTMNHIVNKLATQEIFSFSGIEPEILSIAEKHSLDTVDSSASSAYSAYKNDQSNTTSPFRASTPASKPVKKICTYCRKREHYYLGHLYTECRRLKAEQNNNKSSYAHRV